MENTKELVSTGARGRRGRGGPAEAPAPEGRGAAWAELWAGTERPPVPVWGEAVSQCVGGSWGYPRVLRGTAPWGAGDCSRPGRGLQKQSQRCCSWRVLGSRRGVWPGHVGVACPDPFVAARLCEVRFCPSLLFPPASEKSFSFSRPRSDPLLPLLHCSAGFQQLSPVVLDFKVQFSSVLMLSARVFSLISALRKFWILCGHFPYSVQFL